MKQYVKDNIQTRCSTIKFGGFREMVSTNSQGLSLHKSLSTPLSGCPKSFRGTVFFLGVPLIHICIATRTRGQPQPIHSWHTYLHYMKTHILAFGQITRIQTIKLEMSLFPLLEMMSATHPFCLSVADGLSSYPLFNWSQIEVIIPHAWIHRSTYIYIMDPNTV